MVGLKRVNSVVGDFIQHCQQVLLKRCTYNVDVTKSTLKLLSGSSEDNIESQILQAKYVDSCERCAVLREPSRTWGARQLGVIAISGD